ncbi:MAG: pyridoxamine 5'-phosphate oxidase family protein [Sphaerochaetaceae bacterium]
MNRETALTILKNAEWATLSVITSEDEPYGVPISFVLEGQEIFLHGKQAGKKIAALNNNSTVCLSVVGENRLESEQFTTRYTSVIVYGEAEVVQSPAEKRRALSLLAQKYSPDYSRDAQLLIERAIEKTAVIKIKITEITGKSNIEEENADA